MLVSVFVAAGCAGNVSLNGDDPSSSHSGKSSSKKAGKGNEGTARKELSGLKESAGGSMSGYSRDEFGPAWKDVDHNGCDTRDDILSRDLTDVKKRDKCTVISGRLDDPYTGKDITFAKAHAIDVQIDHVFPLGLAWRMGAKDWTEDKRSQLANDRDNLLAVSSRPNEQKSDKGPSEWQPPKAFECTYAEKFIGVADEYHLSVTHADHTELGDMLDTC
ncbi:HNH endonuclease family protein [Actinomadura sp. DC4]|uniref:HNH endonuclease family protein n=1 Tax=Actinomadura sp. DC4 TaxID=3055069 RepID=UPI0025AFD166|nr:HNH endonuclease family protein [Actinomadura sp. DC4]MDN3357197.1 HNH endonuclease family protein [Actinomadura sp. DC4]